MNPVVLRLIGGALLLLIGFVAFRVWQGLGEFMAPVASYATLLVAIVSILAGGVLVGRSLRALRERA
jgi:hypothetical protein